MAPTHRTHYLTAPYVAALILAAGCTTNSKVNETHYFSAHRADGSSNIFRVRIEAESQDMESTFQAGSFPAEAVDAVFGEVSADTSPTKERDQLKRAVNVAAEKYAALFTDDGTTIEELEEASKRHAHAVAKLAAAQKSETEGDLDEKFVFVYSTDPGKIIEAINSFLNVRSSPSFLLGSLRIG